MYYIHMNKQVNNQDLYDNYFCVVDLHAITAPHDPKKLRADSLNSAAMYLAAGIDPKKSNLRTIIMINNNYNNNNNNNYNYNNNNNNNLTY